MKAYNWIYFLLICVLCIACAKQIQPKKEHPMSKDEIESLWNKVDSLEKIRQYRSALEQLNEIQQKVDQNLNEADQLKLAFYSAKYRALLEENSSEQTILDFEKQLSTKTSQHHLRIYHSLLGQLYADYANANQFKIANRTNVISESDDISTWSMHELLQKSNWHFNESIKTGLNENSITDINGLLDKSPVQHSFDLNTLLMIRAVKHFSREYSIVAEKTNSFILSDEQAFAKKELFVAHDFQQENQDPNSSKYIAIQLYQKLLDYHADDNDIFEKLNSERLSYMYRVSQSSNKDQLYQQALSDLTPTSDFAKLHLANYWINNQWTNKSINLEEAKALLQEVENSSTDSTLLNDASNLLYTLEMPLLNILLEEVVLPDQSSLFHIDYKNIDDLNLSVVSFPIDQLRNYQRLKSREDQLKFLNKLKPLIEWSIDLPNSAYRQLSTEHKMPALSFGTYALLSKHKNQIAANFFQVSNIAAHSLASSSGLSVQVYERDSGAPNADVTVELIEMHYNGRNYAENELDSKRTDKEGVVNFNGNDKRRTRLSFRKAGDIYDSQRTHNRFYGNNTDQATIHIFADRNLYRPGDRLKAKAIPVIFDKRKKQNRLLINESLDVVVRDPNYQEIHKAELTTNEFGSVSFDFVIDDDRLAGSYTIELRNKSNTIQGSQQFQVEEYKRASFSTTIQFPQEEFVLGDTITITTTSELFAGAPLSNAAVHYRVSRRQNRYWHRRSGHATPDAEIVNGITQTDGNGSATFELPLKASNDINGNFSFDVEVRVVDITGETQFASESINVNKVGIFALLDIASITDNEQLADTDIKFVNSNGAPLSVDLQLEVHQLASPSFWKKNKYWSKMDTMSLALADYTDMPYEYVYNESFEETWKETSIIHEQGIQSKINTKLNLPSLNSGYYVLKIKKDDAIIAEYRFQIVDFSHAVNPSPELLSYRLNKQSFEAGEELVIDFSVPNEQVKLQYLIEKDGSIIKKDWLKQSGQLKEVIQDSDQGGFTIHLRSVFQNRMEYKKIKIDVPYADVQLSYKIDRYKSTLLPGEDVIWKIRFEDHEEKPSITESVWTMYDSSLDQLYRKHEWRKFHLPQYYSRVVGLQYGFNQSNSSILYNVGSRIRSSRPDDSWPDFNTYGFTLGQHHAYGASVLKRRSGAPMAESSMTADAAIQSDANEESEFSDQSVEQVEKGTKQTLRQNFNETVFFYPHVVSEKNGESTIEFKMSDALTSWNVLLFAHDKDGKFVYDTLELKSSQDIYLVANKPRFSRINDDLLMTTKIVNNTDRTIPVETWIEFQDLITGEDITEQILKGVQKKNTSAQPGSSEAITWRLQLSEELNAKHLVFRTGVKHEGGSDVIEDYLPVIDDKQLIRESDALFVRAGAKHSYALDNFGKGTETKLFAELITDLEWQVVQSLPYLTEKSFETSSQYLYQFIANAIGDHIVSNNSNVKKQLQLLQRKENSQDSKLKTNEEFKSINLIATPWVKDANKEQMQIDGILKYLDANQVSQDINKSLKKLLSFQQADGGFSWLKDRPSNIFISGIVLQGIGRLDERNITHEFSDDQLKKLISYVDGHIEKQKQKKARTVFADNLLLMNARSIFHNAYPIKTKIIADLQKDFEQSWTKHSAAEQALIGSISKRLGFSDLVELIYLSITEQAIQSENLGTYWKLNKNYFSNQSSIDRHVTVMEFLQQVDFELPLLTEAKIWLLNNKRTNVWESKPSTSSAVFSFLENDGNNSSRKPSSVSGVNLSLNGETILGDDKVGKGTQSLVQLDAEAVKAGSTLDIHNTNDSPVWVSLFKQYVKPITEINSFNNENISIKKSIFIKKLTEEGPKLVPITDSELKPGDRLTVRLAIENDRSLQFVHIEDKRASGLEPKDVISRYHYTDALFYYQVTKDQTTHFLISHLPEGSHVLEYDLTVNLKGNYSSGYSSIQCQYAPEFGAHSKSVQLNIEE